MKFTYLLEKVLLSSVVMAATNSLGQRQLVSSHGKNQVVEGSGGRHSA